ncbi:hypothetical protein HK099_001237 [Clydaea vesicula]|uniref:DUS-like FMN-binding domain-containing protein n=1 Tax=Clydaea vesicula TaxID=447962 RepID=A0AAD5U3M2_9FUNG|nr:hypothetical protein HK099_001237 [Clydaea vesicula]
MNHQTTQLMLAPMVRISSLPFRLLAAKYGAHQVYSPEIVDKRLIATTRVINKNLNTIDFLDPSNSLCLRIHVNEKLNSKLVLQLGTACPELALQAALKVKDDVYGIDINCGCPKKFSIHAGMILKKLVDNLNIPITCKIRLLGEKEVDISATIDLLKQIEQTGVSAVAVHCRTREERPRDRAHVDVFKQLVKAIKIPLIANGDIFDFDTYLKLKSYGVDNFMLARAAQDNPSVFKLLTNQINDGVSHYTINDVFEVCKEYLKIAIEFDNPTANTKYCILQMVQPKLGEVKKKVTFLRRETVGGNRGVPKSTRIIELQLPIKDAVAQAKTMQELW